MKKFKKFFLCIGLALIMVITPAMLMACGKKEEKGILNIELTGEYTGEYFVGDKFNFEDLQLLITYVDDSTKLIDLKSSMLRKFDTTTPGKDKVFFIYYKDKVISKKYNVSAQLKYGYFDKTTFNEEGRETAKKEYAIRILSTGVATGEEFAEGTYLTLKNNTVKFTTGNDEHTYKLENSQTLKNEHGDGSYDLYTWHETIKFGFYDIAYYSKENELTELSKDGFEFRADGNIVDRTEGSLVYTFKWAYQDGQIVYTSSDEEIEPNTVINSETLKHIYEDGEYYLITFSHA